MIERGGDFSFYMSRVLMIQYTKKNNFPVEVKVGSNYFHFGLQGRPKVSRGLETTHVDQTVSILGVS